MPNVRCTALQAVSLPSGALLPPGKDATVDLGDPEVAQLIADERLIALPNAISDVPAKAADVLTWVGDDLDRAGRALAVENSRPEADRRSSVLERLDQLLASGDEHTNDHQEA